MHFLRSQVLWLAFSLPLAGEETAFDAYMKKPDPTYSWKVEKTSEQEGLKTFAVRLKSQTWRAEKEVDRPVWEHWLMVVKPERPAAKTGFLLIGGGSNGGSPPEKADDIVLRIARDTSAVAADLRMVPNQPLVFNGDGKKRKEDDLIAYAWDQFIQTGDPTWLPRLPMVKSAARAMDCIQELLRREEGRSETGGRVGVEKFVVAGGSKRGWTTWMTGAMDPRVEAIVPIVIDVVNVYPSMLHHAAAYGFWAKAIGNYVEHRITERWDHPRLKELYRLVDPYFYRDRLTMPKFIVNASGDQFFCPDSSQFYFDDLKGEKHLRYVPNADHSLKGSDAIDSITAFYQMVLNGTPRPRLSWTFERDGSIRAQADPAPKSVLLWQASNPKARDFRVESIGRSYQSRELPRDPGGAYIGKVAAPETGWTAFYIELAFDSGGKYPLKLTTAVRVLPETLPHNDIDPKKVPYEPFAKEKP